ncbi:MARVEL domain-containing protein 3 isoform X1 [Polyodon spathula]|uniref:MARVEL domain-containing protein 3 isoform X1 n=1 Tax=Polyodon spathula TaxID=7913 RepID=UPI001B7E4BF2|nr:MARVEL domain-containing protein 3 isoform X1 [Polyodon spathula]XP_041078039.1 MARVEL domain-containing protein 3 isoform X1 [Polyodon spathula]
MSAGGRYPEQDNYRPRSRERGERDPHRDRDRENRPKKERGDGRGQRDRDRKRERHSRDQYDDKRDQYSRDQRHNREPPYPTAPPDYSETSFKENQPVHHREERYDETSSVSYGSPRNGLPPEQMDFYEPGPGLLECYQCRYLCTGRALCQVLEVLLNLLLVICAGVSFNASETYKDYGSLGGIYAYYFGGANTFTGAEAEKVKKLDTQFYQLKLPIATATMAFGGALMGYACLMLLLGLLRVPFRWPVILLVECVLGVLIGLGYVPAMAFHFIKLQEAYNSQICKDRNEMYASKGYQGFSCGLNGAEIASGLFGVLGVLAFPFSAWLAVRAFRRVRELKKQPQDGHGF